jgi:cob(I)alamin adenosyltransferase
MKVVQLSFVGSNKFMLKDTAVVTIIVRDALNYPLALEEYDRIIKSINTYVLQLKYTFLQLDKNVKKVKSTRTTFDITGSTAALTGSILNSSSNEKTQKTGRVLPSIGVSLVPVKEAVAPPKNFDQNQASLIRSSIKRLDYMIRDNSLIGERDARIKEKTNKLKEELKQIQIQLIDIPIEITNNMTEEELNQYFNSPKVNRKYRIKK